METLYYENDNLIFWLKDLKVVLFHFQHSKNTKKTKYANISHDNTGLTHSKWYVSSQDLN